MVERVAERIDMGDKGKPVYVNLYDNADLTRDVSYVLRGYQTLEALGKGPKIQVEKGIRVYSAKLPQYKRTHEGIGINSGFISPSPKDKGVYWLVVDERLDESERLAVIAHEISHLAGGHHNDEKKTQKLAIQTLTYLLKGYEDFSNKKISEILQKERGIKFNAGEKEKEDVKGALQYLINSGKYFGVRQNDWHDAGIRSSGRGIDDRIIGIFFIFFGVIFLVFYSANITGNSIGIDHNKGKIMLGGFVFLLFGVIILMIIKLKRGNLLK